MILTGDIFFIGMICCFWNRWLEVGELLIFLFEENNDVYYFLTSSTIVNSQFVRFIREM